MIAGLLVLAMVAAVVTAVGGLYAWITSAPRADQHGVVATFRRWLHSRIETEKLFCGFCRNELAVENGYCSTECGERDRTMQAIA
ncbi:hypothetical protein [Curtobacterium sp. MCBD17_008]|uniref:hypothetical protein n=1 Tax=Curtobacterium sp. MCBD17_008 TaxID=2175656 RepID=UPI000DAAC243|nr:hypothetical protein [Curtobacterium sp. MCBD17_008]PZE89928.1 hypothetical protein DEI95_12970 [Curtobacterium sp. MCBD17_008]